MWRIFGVIALVAMLYSVQPAAAQTPAGKDDVKKLEADLDKLQSQLKDLEARLKKAKAEGAKKDGKFPGPPWAAGGGFGKMDPEQMKKMMEQFKDKGGPFGKMDPEQMKKLQEQFKGKGGPFGKMDPEELKKMMEQFKGKGGPFGKKDPEPMKKKVDPSGSATTREPATDLDRRLDRLLKELEDLRREIRKK